MADWEQIVVGSGSSALTFLFAASRGSESKEFASKKTLVIGEDDLWKGAHGGASGSKPGQRGFEMGQPEDLLYPLNKTAKPDGNVSFLTTNQYTKEQAELKEQVIKDYAQKGGKIEFMRDKVKPMGVRRSGAGFTVSTVKFSQSQTAQQVVIASGAGPNQSLSKMQIEIKNQERLKNRAGRDYPEVISGEEYVKWHPNKTGLWIMVYGPAPSAAWAAAHAMYSKPDALMWVARSGFAEANPAGRNSAIILHASENDAMWIGTVKGIDVLDVPTGPRLSVSMSPSTGNTNMTMPLRTQGDSPFQVEGEINVVRQNSTVEVDQFVYATGADPLGDFGPGNILDTTLRKELLPYYDKSGRFNSESALVAFATPKEDLWIVGASVFRALGGIENFKMEDLKNQYQTIPEMFCDAGTPPEGLAVVKALIKSVTGYNEPGGERFNWNTADKVELVKFLELRYKQTLDPADRAFIADKVILRRSGKDVGRKDNVPKTPGHYPAFGLTEEEFYKCISDAAAERGKKIETKWTVQTSGAVKLTGR